MGSDTKTGVNYQAYTDQLRELSFALEEVEAAELGSKEFRQDAAAAVRRYKSAATAWGLKIQDSDDYITVRNGALITGEGIEADVKAAEAVSDLPYSGSKIYYDDLIQGHWAKAGEAAGKVLEELE